MTKSRAKYYVEMFLDNGVTAHRGNPEEFPENTLLSFKSGIELGADWIELDIWKTADGQLVICHDETTGSTADKDLIIPKSTYSELCNLDMACQFRNAKGLTLEKCPKATIPLLSQVIDLVCSQTKTRMSIQPKDNCVVEAIEMIKKKQAELWVGFNDIDLEKMKQVKKLAPSIPVFWDRYKENIDEDILTAKRYGFETIVLYEADVAMGKIKKVHEAGLKIGAWTVDDSKIMRQFNSMGIDRIYTDRPRELLRIKLRGEWVTS